MMERIIRTGFEAVTHSIDFNKQTLIKGKLLCVSHVRRVEEFIHGDQSIIKSLVIRQTSVTSPPYDVSLELDKNRHIRNVKCTCIAHNSGKCKHVCALIHYINCDQSRSKTSEEQEWGKPSAKQLGKEIYSKGKLLSELFGRKNENLPRVPIYDLKSSDLGNCPLKNNLFEEERSESDHICSHLLRVCISEVVEVVEKERCKVCLINLVIMSQNDYLYLGEKPILNDVIEKFYNEKVVLSESEIIDLGIRTTDQASNSEWHESRKLRITASSKAHSIKNCQQKNLRKLAENLVHPKKSCAKAQEYGMKKEMLALNQYKVIHNVDVINIGFFVSPIQPWLGVSVDGIVIENGVITKIVEIKCPFTCRNQPVIDSLNEHCNVPYLRITNYGVELNQNHQYYTQCQMQMYITGVTACDLFVWSPLSCITVELHRDENLLASLVPKLQKFYFDYYIVALQSQPEHVEM